MKINLFFSFFELNEAALSVSIKAEKGTILEIEVASVDLGSLVVSEISDFEYSILSHDLEVVILLVLLE